MTIAAGTRLGHYEIVAPIGAGGMGQVYRAKDTRLDRTVAVKVLPDAFASNAQLRSRFEREAKVISSLSHPNICTLHDVGSVDGVDYLVMEHLEGETLADRIARGPMPLPDVFRYASEIAEALSRAHRAGIVHRDLKPSNVMLTRDGAKLLDFGLAKILRQGNNDVTAVLEGATQKRDDLTSEGTVLGTYPYMSPEQLEGEDADARSDLFAFGALLYEMLTAKRAFGGKTRASVIAAILAAEPPPVSTLRPVTPAGLDRLVRTCLQKDPDERWQSAHDVKLELEILRTASPDSEAGASKGKSSLLPWGIAALLGLLAVGALLSQLRAKPVAATPLVVSVTGAGYQFNVVDGPAVISPDGKSIVVRAFRQGSPEMLLVRRLDREEFVPLSGTEGVIDPFWSPDSQHIAYFDDGKLMRVPASGGPITTLCSVTGDPRGGAWAGDTILFSPAANRALQRVHASGGTPVEVMPLAARQGEIGQWRPAFLPDGRHYLYQSLNAAQDRWGIYLGDLEKKTTPRLLIDAATTAIYAEPGYLLYAYGGHLYAQPFDAKTLEKSGAPALILRNIEYNSQYGSAGYSASRNGMLALHTWLGDTRSEISLLAPDGSMTNTKIEGDNLDLSHDGTKLALQVASSSSRSPDLWTIDLIRGTKARITSDPSPDIGPVWSPDGKQIAYVSSLIGYQSVRIRSSTAGGEPTEVLRSAVGMEITDWSADGRYLVAEVFNEATSADIAVIDLQGKRTLEPIIASRFGEDSPRISPDGRFLSYQSNEGGQLDVYVTPFPAADQRWQVSTSGGGAARWSADGRKLYYVSMDRRMNVVAIDTSKGFDFGMPVSYGDSISQNISDPTPAGAIYVTTQKPSTNGITLLTDWTRTHLPNTGTPR